jgi:hypothetical protein
MKKSEMLNVITEVIAMYRTMPDYSELYLSNDRLAAVILNVIENKGMKPPEVKQWDSMQWVTDEYGTYSAHFYLNGKRVKTPDNTFEKLQYWEEE